MLSLAFWTGNQQFRADFTPNRGGLKVTEVA